ncbi:zinc knuckle [Cooperia oncophora]
MQIQHNAKTVHSGEARKASIGDRSSATQEPKYGEAIQGRKCYHCSKYGHIARECPSRMGNVNHRDRKKFPSENGETKVSSIIKQNHSMGVKIQKRRSEKSDLIGKRIMVPVRLLEERHMALVDTGSMISVIPLKALERAQNRGFDVDLLQVVPKSKLKPVFDASNNRMNLVAAVYIQVETENGQRETIAFHISPDKEAETIIGTNALNKLGIDVRMNSAKLKDDTSLIKEENKNKVVVAKRVYIPPHDAALVSVICEEDTKDHIERVIWPSEDGVELGVYTIKNQRTAVPIFNNSPEPRLFKEGEKVGHWGTDKWHERWEEWNPLMADETDNKLSESERLQKLESLLTANTESQVLDEEIKDLVKEYTEVEAKTNLGESSASDLFFLCSISVRCFPINCCVTNPFDHRSNRS